MREVSLKVKDLKHRGLFKKKKKKKRLDQLELKDRGKVL